MKAYQGGSKISSRFPCIFSTLDNESLSVTGVSIVQEAEDHNGNPRCELTIETHAALAERLMAEEHFLLLSGTTAFTPSFAHEEPVVIRLRLRQRLAVRLHENKQDSEAVLRGLLGQDEHLRVLQHTESWLALDLMQNIALPEEVAHQGRVQQGVQTHWAKSYPSPALSTDGTLPNQVQATNLDVDVVSEDDATIALETALAQLKLRYERVSPQILRLSFSTTTGSTWRMLLYVGVGQTATWYSIYSVFPDPVPASAHPAVAVQLMSANYDSFSGAFELDAEDGALRYRTSFPHTAAINAEHLNAVLEEHQIIMAAYLPLAIDWNALQ